MPKRTLPLLLFLFLSSLLLAQDITGDWYGVLDFDGYRLRINLHVQKNDGAYLATLDSPDQDALGMPVSRFLYEPPRVEFQMPDLQVLYLGEVNEDFSLIEGTFQQAGSPQSLNFGRTPIETGDPDMRFIKDNYRKMETYIPMRDGVRLFTSIYLPRDSSRDYPILMWRTPYSVRPYGEEEYSQRLKYYMHLLRDKYILVPIVNTWWDQYPGLWNPLNLPDPLSIKDLRAICAYFMDQAIVTCTIDGKEVWRPERFRFKTPVFSLMFDPEFATWYGYDTPYLRTAVGDGYFLILKPLKPGQHTIKFTGEIPSIQFLVDVTYNITVE